MGIILTTINTIVKAAVLFGDVTHVANQTYNTANGTADNGVRSLPKLAQSSPHPGPMGLVIVENQETADRRLA